MSDPALTNRLKVLRAERNLTQADLADLVATTRKSINAIEASRMVPSTLLALKLARALGVAVEDIFELA
ncbi:helix-turn-helix domain-containing protein [Luteibacter pinisoli]|uniref:Helix-turn-helix domain-containing protein n=1 Tax=Luteibacter pinisoli TaxID=2589080 RepID=A0A4Y5Z5G0_9GAMM|nr:helix-turn-helix domain-containing protein [Luteibacter pinisoli]QDE40364.1 helix-turn-helix domain-containing protein [Luteibacter pinisoli]